MRILLRRKPETELEPKVLVFCSDCKTRSKKKHAH